MTIRTLAELKHIIQGTRFDRRDLVAMQDIVDTLELTDTQARLAFSAAGRTVQGNQLLSGTVTWVSGLTFYISDCVFVIDETIYEAEGGEVTLSAADATNPRIDVFYADIDGTTGVLEGSAAADPTKPAVDTLERVELSFALVDAMATTPTGVSNTVVYDEDDDWTTAQSGTGADKDSTVDPAAGTKHIAFIAAAKRAYVSLTPSAEVSTGAYTKITFQFKPVDLATLGNNATFALLEFYRGNRRAAIVSLSHGTYGIDKNLAQYQTISVPISDVKLASFDSMRIVHLRAGRSMYFDNIYLQTGTYEPAAGNYAYTDISNPWSASQYSPIVQLTDGATITVDLSLANVFEVTLDGNRTIDFTNAKPGMHFTMIVKQDDTTGSRTLTWDAANDWAGGTAPTLSTATDAVDVLSFMVDSAGNIHGSLGIADSQ